APRSSVPRSSRKSPAPSYGTAAPPKPANRPTSANRADARIPTPAPAAGRSEDRSLGRTAALGPGAAFALLPSPLRLPTASLTRFHTLVHQGVVGLLHCNMRSGPAPTVQPFVQSPGPLGRTSPAVLTPSTASSLRRGIRERLSHEDRTQ